MIGRVEIEIAGATLRLAPLNDADAEYPLFVGTGTLRMAARAGQSSGLGVGESPSLDVHLLNNKRQAHALIGTPHRAPVRVYNRDETIFFEGIVAGVALGRTMTLTVES